MRQAQQFAKRRFTKEASITEADIANICSATSERFGISPETVRVWIERWLTTIELDAA